MHRLPLLTNSSINTYRRCPREYFFYVVLRRRSKRKSEALRFGSFFHVGLNAWWRAGGPAEDRLSAALATMLTRSRSTEDADPFALVKAEELILGYTAMWGNEPYERMVVELQFRLPLAVHPQGDGSTHYELGGAVDAIVKNLSADKRVHESVHVVEHKTTSQDISNGSDYWRHVVALDPQVSTYMSAAKQLGHNPRDTIYDVIRKPNLLPLKATPEELKKYTKPTAKEPIPRLYANQREEDETPEEYRQRIRTEISSNPEKYFARKAIVRLESDDEKHAEDVRQTAEMIRFSTEHDAWPRTPTACERYGRLCDYHDVCSGSASIDDSRFETKEKEHEELDI